jgi:mono/diheme cytochrome c family protein
MSRMAYPFMTLRRYLPLILLLTITGSAQADAGKELFEAKCTGCHTIGGGDGAGPDLKGVAARRPADWLVRVIAEPDQLTAQKDATQLELIKKYGMEMPKLGISRDDAQKIVTFLQAGAAQPAAKEGASPAPTAAAAPSNQVKSGETVPTKELLSSGRALFTGEKRFAKGGAPCGSCHSLRYPGVNGGTLAADLTGIYAKMGESGVRGVLNSLSFPVMKGIYARRPLSEDEATALVALFKDAAARPQAPCDIYPLVGLGFFVIFIVVAILFKRRIR